MFIRKSTSGDLTRIIEIYNLARAFMINTGNPSQWNDNYPSIELVRADIQRGVSYVVIDKNKIIGTFVFIIGGDPTYARIDGKWLNDSLYGTIHRIASDGSSKGVADACLRYCQKIIDNIRIDTHADNSVMLNWITRSGFKYCGIIHVADGTPRLAFHLTPHTINKDDSATADMSII